MTWTPFHFLIVAISGWMNREQQQVIDYLREENRILREKLGRKRIILNESQKLRLATAAMKLGKDLLQQWGTLFSPATLLRWHRWFVARKYDGTGKRGPAPKKANSIRKLVLQMAEENPSWGDGHIHGELKGLGYKVSWQTIRRVMLDHGLLLDPDKPYKTTWKTFLQSHWDSIAACDVFSVEAWCPKGLTRYLVFFVIKVATRKVEIVGIHENPSGEHMVQWARNLTDAQDGFLKDKRILIHDRDPLYTRKFRETLAAAGAGWHWPAKAARLRGGPLLLAGSADRQTHDGTGPEPLCRRGRQPAGRAAVPVPRDSVHVPGRPGRDVRQQLGRTDDPPGRPAE